MCWQLRSSNVLNLANDVKPGLTSDMGARIRLQALSYGRTNSKEFFRLCLRKPLRKSYAYFASENEASTGNDTWLHLKEIQKQYIKVYYRICISVFGRYSHLNQRTVRHFGLIFKLINNVLVTTQQGKSFKATPKYLPTSPS